MGQGGAFVELITVRRGAYARCYIQTALKVVAINPRSPFGPPRRASYMRSRLPSGYSWQLIGRTKMLTEELREYIFRSAWDSIGGSKMHYRDMPVSTSEYVNPMRLFVIIPDRKYDRKRCQ